MLLQGKDRFVHDSQTEDRLDSCSGLAGYVDLEVGLLAGRIHLLVELYVQSQVGGCVHDHQAGIAHDLTPRQESVGVDGQCSVQVGRQIHGNIGSAVGNL